MSDNVSQFPRPIRSVPQPLGLYLRIGHHDHTQLSTLLLSGQQKFFGAVIDATLVERHKDLGAQIARSRLDLILDPKTQAAATPGGFKLSMSSLPWGADRPQGPEDFRSLNGRQKAIKLAEFAVEHGFTQVMAPTHLISSPNDEWLGLDVQMTHWLRAELDRRGGQRMPIIYSLAASYKLLKNAEERAAIIAALSDVPVDSVWLKIDGFGASANPTATSNYLDAAIDFHNLDVPLVADQVGGIPALSLLAFGAVGGISHGITTNESFRSYSWRAPQEKRGGGGGWRVYMPSLDIMLKPDEATLLLESSSRAKSLFANRNAQACPRGVVDMLENPLKAFVVQRADEVANLRAIPPDLRPQSFLDQHVRPATDRALAATKIDWGANALGLKLGKKLSGHRKHLDDLRISLGARAGAAPPNSISMQPKTRIVRENTR